MFGSQSALGSFFRRQKSKLGAPKAITATAYKIARLLYAMLRYGQEYVDAGLDYYETQYQGRVLKNLTKKAEILGLQLVPVVVTEKVP